MRSRKVSTYVLKDSFGRYYTHESWLYTQEELKEAYLKQENGGKIAEKGGIQA